MILCCGEALIDMIPEPTQAGRDGFVPHSGGAVFNTAIALGRLGAQVGMVTGLSSDLFGQQLRADLAASHVDSQLVITGNRPTTLAFVRLVDGQARYAFYDENTAGRMLAPDQMPALPASVSALFVGGISLAVEPAAEAYAALVSQQKAGRVVMLDPNIRPGFVQNGASYRARINGLLRLADIVKVSDEDLDWLAPSAAPLADRVGALLAMGPLLVIVTRGRAGAQAWLANGGQAAVAARPVTVVDTVGAGDTFNAGVLAHLQRCGLLSRKALQELSQQDLQAALALGNAAASITVSRRGANSPWAHELASVG